MDKTLEKKLPACPFNGKMSFESRRIPPEMRVCFGGGKWIKPYKCKHCPYWHQSKRG